MRHAIHRWAIPFSKIQDVFRSTIVVSSFCCECSTYFLTSSIIALITSAARRILSFRTISRNLSSSNSSQIWCIVEFGYGHRVASCQMKRFTFLKYANTLEPVGTSDFSPTPDKTNLVSAKHFVTWTGCQAYTLASTISEMRNRHA